ncbi:hypothetical protein ABZ912_26735 [Nonomuraea angiospora]|uniref:hypothetical protein n=1 Tax=Nonomuraea angiospora TaxID=46172 RepID=UPI0033F48B56
MIEGATLALAASAVVVAVAALVIHSAGKGLALTALLGMVTGGLRTAVIGRTIAGDSRGRGQSASSSRSRSISSSVL